MLNLSVQSYQAEAVRAFCGLWRLQKEQIAAPTLEISGVAGCDSTRVLQGGNKKDAMFQLPVFVSMEKLRLHTKTGAKITAP